MENNLFGYPEGYLTRAERRNRTQKDLGIKNQGGLFDLFDNVIKETYRITDDEFDYLADNFSEEDIELFVNEELSFGDKRKCLSMVEKHLINYYNNMDTAENREFTENDWNHLHDCILHATRNTTRKKSSMDELKNIFDSLPEDMKNDAYKWGMSDTPWRERFIEWYEENIL